MAHRAAAARTASSVELHANSIPTDQGSSCPGSINNRPQRTQLMARARFSQPSEAVRMPAIATRYCFRHSPEGRLIPFALVNPYAAAFGPETIAAENFPLPCGHSSRSGQRPAKFPFAQVLRCTPPPERGSGPPAPSWPGFIATGFQPPLQEKDYEKHR
jgi:hypothetical protein